MTQAFDFNTATPDQIRAESARRDAKRNGLTLPDPIQAKRKATLLEKEVQQAVIALYKRHGCTVYNYSQPRKAKYLTPGAADLQIFTPMMETWEGQQRIMFYHETKRPKGGVYSDDQLKFASMCRESHIRVIGGGVDEARAQINHLRLNELGASP